MFTVGAALIVNVISGNPGWPVAALLGPIAVLVTLLADPRARSGLRLRSKVGAVGALIGDSMPCLKYRLHPYRKTCPAGSGMSREDRKDGAAQSYDCIPTARRLGK